MNENQMERPSPERPQTKKNASATSASVISPNTRRDPLPIAVGVIALLLICGCVLAAGGSLMAYLLFGKQPQRNASEVAQLTVTRPTEIATPRSVKTATPYLDEGLGLVGYWPFEGNADDASGLGNNGQLLGNPSFGPGQVGQGLSLDGSSYVDVGNAAGLTGLTPKAMSVSAWVYNAQKIRPNGVDLRTVIAQRDATQYAGYGLQYGYVAGYGVDNYVIWIVFWGGYAGAAHYEIEPGQWYHIVGVFENNVPTIYVNGVPVETILSSSGYRSSNANVIIGRQGNYAQRYDYHRGVLDEVRLYNRALSAAEVQALYQATRVAIPYRDEGLALYYSFDEGEGDTVHDLSGNGQDGTIHGSTWQEGKYGNALKFFDGEHSFVSAPKSPALDVGAQVTVEFWMKADPDNLMNACCQGLVATDFYHVEISSGRGGQAGINFVVSADGGSSWTHTSDQAGGGFRVPPGEWHHVAGTYDGAALRLYIDGGLKAKTPHTGSISPMLPNSFLSIGSEEGRSICRECMHSRYFSGLLDEIKIYSRALTEDEIQTDMNSSQSERP